MNDTIRWCLRHKKQQSIVGACEAYFNSGGYMRPVEGECEIVTMVRADQPVYRIVFPNPGDGTQFSESDMMEMEEVWHCLEDAKKAGVLVRLGEEEQ